MTESFLSENTDISKRDYIGRTPLFKACKEGRLDTIGSLIGAGININETDYFGDTALHCACENNQLDAAKLLVSSGADVNITNNMNLTPIMSACEIGNLDLIYVLSHCPQYRCIPKEDPKNTEISNLDPSMENSLGSTMIFYPCFSGDLDQVKFLTDNGVSTNSVNCLGDTPIHYAVRGGNISIAKFLIGAGADVDLKNNKGSSPIAEAYELNNLGMIDALTDKRATSQYTLLLKALLEKKTDIARLLLQKNIGIGEGISDVPFTYACFGSMFDIIDLMIRKGVRVNNLGKGGSVLHFLCADRNKRVFSYLLGKNIVDTEERDKEGVTVLQKAYINKQVKIIQLLVLEGRANINVKNEFGITPVYDAYLKKDNELLEMLVSLNADIWSTDFSDEPLIHMAFRDKRDDVISLLGKGSLTYSKTSVSDYLMRTPLHEVSSRGYHELVETIISNGADIDAQDRVGNTSLHIACLKELLEVIRVLLKNNAKTNTKNNIGQTPLSVIPVNGKQRDVIRELILRHQRQIAQQKSD